MKLSLLPPLFILCSILLLSNSLPISAKVIFSPTVELCAVRKVEPASRFKLQLGPCDQAQQWTYTPEKMLIADGESLCLQAIGAGKAVGFGVLCHNTDSTWELMTNSKEQFSTRIPGSTLCLDLDPNNILISNPCGQQPGQWFTLR
ncbi:glycosyl hydrolase 5 family protein-like [Canna indica]|uniref:Glycosyl hydrolase 5 family protein-like n=1 Tax=Canna indica TaxID=4628 RepID=A0AAQ3KUW2_9LILI|nr:glycosyl hydrolase 5 family protein-like [Canna indica]